jgi:predicted ATPase/transcriptional regulator with XRE-family HTH domain
MMNPETRFGVWVRRRRKALDLTQGELARRLGCSLSLIVKIESDERRPSRQIAELLATHLAIPPEQRELFLQVARKAKAVDNLDELPAPVMDGSAPPKSPLHTHLPRPLTPIVGRGHELEVLSQQIQNPACRLLTLTGPGGVGKTRLALEAAQSLEKGFEHGAHFVALAGTGAPEFIIPAIADALGFLFSGTRDLKSQLFGFLREKHLLLMLDNLEHLLEGIEVLDELLEKAPRVKLLATSREPLSLRAEWSFEVQGLPIPADQEGMQGEPNSAVDLFMQRARQTRSSFIPAPEDLQAITRICRLVDGLPLGIELAATWVRMMEPVEISREIERSLDFLTTSARDVPQRHRSIRSVFDYSWNLLTDEEQRILRQLAVFSGGFTREAAAHVAGANLSHLSALVAKSLLRRDGLHTDWYDFHVLIQQYINLKAEGLPRENERLHERHAGYYAAWLHQLEKALEGPEQEATLLRIGLEIDNVRSAWNWMVEHHHTYHLQLSLASLFVLHDIRNWLHQGVALFELAVAAFEDHGKNDHGSREHAILLGELMVCQGHMCWHLGQTQKARDLLQRSLEQIAAERGRPMLAEAFLYLSLLEHSQGDYATARRLAEECVALNRAQERGSGIGYSLSNLGMICISQGEYEKAYAFLKDGLAVMQSIGHPRGTAINQARLGFAALKLGRLEEASLLLEQSLETPRRLRDRWGIGCSLNYMGLLAQQQGDLEGAERVLRESAGLFEEDGDRIQMASTLTDLGFILIDREMELEARQTLHKALRVTGQSGSLPVGLYALAGLAILNDRIGEFELAARLALFVSQHPSSPWQAGERSRQLWTQLEGKIDVQQLETIRADLQRASLDGLVQETLASVPG